MIADVTAHELPKTFELINISRLFPLTPSDLSANLREILEDKVHRYPYPGVSRQKSFFTVITLEGSGGNGSIKRHITFKRLSRECHNTNVLKFPNRPQTAEYSCL